MKQKMTGRHIVVLRREENLYTAVVEARFVDEAIRRARLDASEYVYELFGQEVKPNDFDIVLAYYDKDYEEANLIAFDTTWV